jgi:hypothetical protein
MLTACLVGHTKHVKLPSHVVHGFRGDAGGIVALNTIVESLASQPDVALHLRAGSGSPRKPRVDWPRTSGPSTG